MPVEYHAKHNKKLIIFDAPDKVGKTTIINELKKSYPAATYLRQPDRYRDEIKNIPGLSGTTRVIFATMSNMIGLSEIMSDDNDLIIQDRSFLSTLIYGDMLNANADFMKYMYEMYVESFKHVKRDIIFVVFNNYEPIKKDDHDVYSRMNWLDIRDKYVEFNYDQLVMNLQNDDSKYLRIVRIIENTDIQKTVERVKSFVGY
jgi:thymidylate kinase